MGVEKFVEMTRLGTCTFVNCSQLKRVWINSRLLLAEDVTGFRHFVRLRNFVRLRTEPVFFFINSLAAGMHASAINRNLWIGCTNLSIPAPIYWLDSEMSSDWQFKMSNAECDWVSVASDCVRYTIISCNLARSQHYNIAYAKDKIHLENLWLCNW